MSKSAEFILQPHLPSVVLVEPFGPNFSTIAQALVQDPQLQVVECLSAMDTVSIVRQMGACLILAHASSDANVIQQLTILKMLAAQVLQKHNVRMLLTVASSLNAELVEKLTTYGCSEIVSDTTPLTELNLKIESHIKALPKLAVATPRAAVSVLPSLFERAETSAEVLSEMPPGVRLLPVFGAPLDTWCLSGGGATRAPGGDGEWKVHLRGPAPTHGCWLPVAGKSDVWQWFAEMGVARQNTSYGWYAGSAKEPSFSQGCWTFSGRAPWLGYLENGEPTGHKFKISEKGSLCIARDSSSALSWLASVRGKTSGKTSDKALGKASDKASDKTSDKTSVKILSKTSRGGGSPEARTASSEAAAGPRDVQIVYVDPLLIESDFWLLEKTQPKRIAERWLVQLLGPGPAVGRWIAQEGPGASSEKWWSWKPDAGEKDIFSKELGSWFYYGLAPNFTTDGLWSFASSNPELAFYFGGACYGIKFKLRGDGALEVARDSAAALAMAPLLRQSHERQVGVRSKTAPPIGAPTAPPIGPPVSSDDPRGFKIPVETSDASGSVEFADASDRPDASGRPEFAATSELADASGRPEFAATSELADASGRPEFADIPISADVPIFADAPLESDSLANQFNEVEVPPVAPPGLEAIFAATAPGPTLSPLALTYLASELIARRTGSIRERCDRYCAYLMASYGGLRVEVWIPPFGGAKEWTCVGTSDASSPRFEKLVSKGAEMTRFEGKPVRVTEVRPTLQNPIGLIVVGGQGAQRIEPAYAQAAARAAVGLVLGARSQVASGEVSAAEAA